jgi:formylglycine-generating enzyme required for sulfatase activity
MLGNLPEIHPIPADSNLQLIYDRRLECVDGFLMSDHEVTNNEYREFVSYVKDSVMRAALALKFPEFYMDGKSGRLNFEKEIDWESEGIYSVLEKSFYDDEGGSGFFSRDNFRNETLLFTYTVEDGIIRTTSIYPDSTVWARGPGSEYFWTLSDTYCSHSAYDDYPVVGVTYEMSIAYAHWKSKQLNLRFPSLKLGVDLPDEFEWESAALLNSQPYGGIFSNDVPCSLEKTALYSRYTYDNGEWFRDYCSSHDDTWINPIRSKAPGEAALYDMGGNVAEFVKSTPNNCQCERELYGHNWYGRRRFTNLSIPIEQGDNLESIKVKILIENADDLSNIDTKRLEEYLREMAGVLMHDAQLMDKFDEYHIIRGGSRLSPIYHCLPQARVLVEATHSDKETGFRIVIHAPQEVLMAFVEKEKRKRYLTAEEHFELEIEYWVGAYSPIFDFLETNLLRGPHPPPSPEGEGTDSAN